MDEKQNENNIVMEPPLYFANDTIFDIDFHPSTNLIACALITGEIQIIQYEEEDVQSLLTLKPHKNSCRSLKFSPNGLVLASCSKDKSIALLNKDGKVQSKIQNAHSNPINIINFINDDILVSGDDDGQVQIWDLRNNQSIYQLNEQKECINDIITDSNQNYAFAASGEGNISIINLKKLQKNKFFQISDSVDEDLLSLSLVKNNQFLIASSGEGQIYLYKWEQFCSSIDKISLHKFSVDSLAKYNENIIITGSEDGNIRTMGVYPNQILSIIGRHSEDEEKFPISKISISHCKQLCATSSFDNSIKFYDISYLSKIQITNDNIQDESEYINNQNQLNQETFFDKL